MPLEHRSHTADESLWVIGWDFRDPKWLFLLNLACHGHRLCSVLPAPSYGDQTQTLGCRDPSNSTPPHSFLENSPFLARSGCSFHKLTAPFQEAAQTLWRSQRSFREESCLQHQHINMMASNRNQIAKRATWPAFAAVCVTSAYWVSFWSR